MNDYNFKHFVNRWEKANLGKIKDEDLAFSSSTRFIDEVEKKGHDYFNIDTKNSQKWINNLDALVSSVLGWIHCNPSIPSTVELTKEAFVWPKSDKEHTNSFNTKVGMDNFFDYLTDKRPNKRMVAIVGPKGQGKTYTQNYFLNTRSKDLAQKGFVWFRIDLTKILKYEEEFNKTLTLAEYLYAQITYVFFRYHTPLEDRDEDPIFNKINISELEQHAKNLYKTETGKNDFSKYYDDIRKNSRIIFPTNTGLNKPFKNPIVSFVAKAIIELLKKEGYLYLLFIDGIDNVDYAFDRNLNDWIDQILHGDIGKNIPPSIRILTCRIETYHFIKQQKKINGGIRQALGFAPEVYTLEPLQVSDIFEKTIKPIVHGNLFTKPIMKKLFENFKHNFDYKLALHSPHEKINDYYKFGSQYTTHIADYLIENNILKTIYPDEILEKLYNNSLRDMIFDIKHAYMYIYRYMIEENKRHDNKNSQILVSRYIQKHNSHLIIAAIARRGKIYCNDVSIFSPPFMLLHSLNIIMPFNFGSMVGFSGKDMLLSHLILTYIKEHENSTKDEIIKYCVDHRYKKENIIKFDRKLLEHGLIEISILKANEKGNYKLPRKLTQRGYFLLMEAMHNPNLLHAYSYETYFPNIFIHGHILKAYKNNFEEYASAQIMNVLSLLKLLQLHIQRNTLPDINLFNGRIINLLEKYYNKLPDSEKKEIINIFERFILKYNKDNSGCDINIDKLLEWVKDGRISNEEFKVLLERCK